MSESSGLGSRIKALREQNNWTQKDLERRAGISQSNITLLESGKRTDIKLDTITKIAGAFRITTDELIGYDKDAIPEPALDGADSRRLDVVESGLKDVQAGLADLAGMVREGFEQVQNRLPATAARKTPTTRKRS